jgi:hypothetical protein
MGDYDPVSNDWLATGATGTPARDAALPKYRSDTQDWARKSQNDPRGTAMTLSISVSMYSAITWRGRRETT